VAILIVVVLAATFGFVAWRPLSIQWHDARGESLWRQGRKAEAREHFKAASGLGSQRLSTEKLELYAEQIGEAMKDGQRFNVSPDGSAVDSKSPR